MPGLRRADDATFVRALQELNVAILNPAFGIVFTGSMIVSVAAVVVTFHDTAVRPWTVGALVLVLATIVVTAAANVPLNDALAAGSGSPAALRAAFEKPWVAWNTVRTATRCRGVALGGCRTVAPCPAPVWPASRGNAQHPAGGTRMAPAAES